MSNSKLFNIGLFTFAFGVAALSMPLSAGAQTGVGAGISQMLSNTISAECEDEVSSSDADTEEGDVFSEYTNFGIAKIDSGALNVRKGSDESHSLVGKMKNGSACNILTEKNGWYKIESGKVTGWVKSDYILTGDEAIEYAQDYISTIATVNTTTLNVREKPTTDSAIWYLVPKGEELEVTDDLGDWIEVEIDDDTVYVAAEYVDISQELQTALTISEATYGSGVSKSFTCKLCTSVCRKPLCLGRYIAYKRM